MTHDLGKIGEERERERVTVSFPPVIHARDRPGPGAGPVDVSEVGKKSRHPNGREGNQRLGFRDRLVLADRLGEG